MKGVSFVSRLIFFVYVSSFPASFVEKTVFLYSTAFAPLSKIS